MLPNPSVTCSETWYVTPAVSADAEMFTRPTSPLAFNSLTAGCTNASAVLSPTAVTVQLYCTGRPPGSGIADASITSGVHGGSVVGTVNAAVSAVTASVPAVTGVVSKTAGPG